MLENKSKALEMLAKLGVMLENHLQNILDLEKAINHINKFIFRLFLAYHLY